MALDLAQLPQALRDHGVRVIEYGPWLTRGYDTVTFLGQLNHHTAIAGPITASTAEAMVRGRPDLAGPLCNGHGGLDADGRFVLYLIAGRRARHAGPGSSVVFGEYLADLHNDRTAAERGLADDDAAHGNRNLFGWEWQHPGTTPEWADALLEGVGRCNAALAGLAGWSVNRSKGHKHWTRRKIDPSWPGSLPALTARYAPGDDMTPAQEALLRETLAAVQALAEDEDTRHDYLLNRKGHGELPDILAGQDVTLAAIKALPAATTGGLDPQAITDAVKAGVLAAFREAGGAG